MIMATSLRLATFAALAVVAFGIATPSQARIHGTRTQRNGHQIGHVGGTYRNAQGGVVHAAGTRVSGANGTAEHGRSTTLNPDGSMTHHGVTRVNGVNGANATGSNSYTRNADDSWNANRQVDASGARGSYSSNTTASNGTASRDRTITNANGDSYSGQTSWSKGQGVTHTSSCSDAGGNTIPCGH